MSANIIGEIFFSHKNSFSTNLFIYSGLGELNFGVLPVSGVDNSSATNLSDLLTVTIEAPAADLVAANNILDEENSVAEPQTQLVKQFNVLQEVVIAGPSIAVLVSVDQKLHHGLNVVGVDQSLLLLLTRDQRHSADGNKISAPASL